MISSSYHGGVGYIYPMVEWSSIIVEYRSIAPFQAASRHFYAYFEGRLGVLSALNFVLGCQPTKQLYMRR